MNFVVEFTLLSILACGKPPSELGFWRDQMGMRGVQAGLMGAVVLADFSLSLPQSAFIMPTKRAGQIRHNRGPVAMQMTCQPGCNFTAR